MTEKQITELLEAVEQRVTKAVDEATGPLNERIAELEKAGGDAGLGERLTAVEKAVSDFQETGDQLARQKLLEAFEGLGALRAGTARRRSIEEQEESVEKAASDPLKQGIAIAARGIPVKLT